MSDQNSVPMWIRLGALTAIAMMCMTCTVLLAVSSSATETTEVVYEDDIRYGDGTWTTQGKKLNVGETYTGYSSGITADIKSVWIESTSGPISGVSVSKTGNRSYSYTCTATGVGEGRIVIVYTYGILNNRTTDIYLHDIGSSYTVSFNGNGGSSPSSLTSVNGAAVTLPSSSQSGYSGSGSYYSYYTGYYFQGWYTAASGGTYVGSSGQGYVPSSNSTLYAHWSSSTSYTYQYYVSYNANGGTGAPAQTYNTSGSSSRTVYISSAEPVRDGYDFLGWATSSTATSATYQPGDSVSIRYGLMTLYAVWIETISVTFDPTNGNDPTVVEMNSGSKITDFPPAPAKEGFFFLGWFTDSECTARYQIDSVLTTDTILYAGWKDALAFISEPSASANVVMIGSTGGIVCDASGSSDYISVLWDFGDGSTSSEPYVSHVYSDPGTYRYTLTVTNALGTSQTYGSVAISDDVPDTPADGSEESDSGIPTTAAVIILIFAIVMIIGIVLRIWMLAIPAGLVAALALILAVIL